MAPDAMRTPAGRRGMARLSSGLILFAVLTSFPSVDGRPPLLDRRAPQQRRTTNLIASSIWRRYTVACKHSPVLVNLGTSVVLAIAGDAAMQVIERQRDFDGARLARFLAFRAVIVPLYTQWVAALESLPLATIKPLHAAAIKTTLDMTIWSPVQHVVFFTSMAICEGQRGEEAFLRCTSMLPRTLPASWAFWGPTQLANFCIVPPHLRVAFVNIASLAWNACMSGFNQVARSRPSAAELAL